MHTAPVARKGVLPAVQGLQIPQRSDRCDARRRAAPFCQQCCQFQHLSCFDGERRYAYLAQAAHATDACTC